MAGEIQLNSTTMATESSGAITLSNVDSATNRTNLGLGSIATQAADSVSISGGNITGGTIGSGVVFPARHILNVVNNTKTGTSSTTSTSYVDVTGYSASITPSSASNTVLVLINASLAGSGTSGVGIAVYAGASLVTETKINRASSVDYCASISYEHSPSTESEVTYQIKIKAYSGTAVINQDSGMTSYITLMEIAG
jgi:hypothetical protein